MNTAIICGRLTRDPEVRYSQNGQDQMAIARYTVAVDRPKKNGQDNGADFISCVAFGKRGEFAEKYLRQGMKIIVEGHIQTGSYTNQEGYKVYTTDVIVDATEFAESRRADNQSASAQNTAQDADANGFMHIPDGVDDEGLPFN